MATRALPDLVSRLKLDLPTAQIAEVSAMAKGMGSNFQQSAKAIDAAEKSAGSLHSKIGLLAGSLGEVIAKLAAVSAVAVAGGLVEATKPAGDFRTRMTNLVMR